MTIKSLIFGHGQFFSPGVYVCISGGWWLKKIEEVEGIPTHSFNKI